MVISPEIKYLKPASGIFSSKGQGASSEVLESDLRHLWISHRDSRYANIAPPIILPSLSPATSTALVCEREDILLFFYLPTVWPLIDRSSQLVNEHKITDSPAVTGLNNFNTSEAPDITPVPFSHVPEEGLHTIIKVKLYR